jgi:hypothetical protein
MPSSIGLTLDVSGDRSGKEQMPGHAAVMQNRVTSLS